MYLRVPSGTLLDTELCKCSTGNIRFSDLVRSVGFDPSNVSNPVGGRILVCDMVIMLRND